MTARGDLRQGDSLLRHSGQSGFVDDAVFSAVHRHDHHDQHGLFHCVDSEIVKIDLDGVDLVRHARQHLLVQGLIGDLLHHGFEQCRLDHVEGRLVVVQDGHWPVIGFAQDSGRILLEFGHADGEIGEDGLHSVPLN